MSQMSCGLGFQRALAALIFFCALFLAPFRGASGADLLPVPPVAYLTDTAHILTSEQTRALEDKLSAFEKKTGSQVAVLIVPSTGDEAIEDFAHRVGDSWKIGRKGVGDGLLFIVATGDRRARIDVMRSLEGIIPDVQASRILQNDVFPAFKKGDWYLGINNGLDRIFSLIESAGLPEPKAQPSGGLLYDESEALFDEPWIAVFFIGFVMTMMLRELMGRKSAPAAGIAVGALAAFIMQSLLAGIVIAVFVVIIAMVIPTSVLEAGARRSKNLYRSRKGRGGDDFPGFGGGFGGFGGGGFGGFGGMSSGGGGDSAGGGASGSW